MWPPGIRRGALLMHAKVSMSVAPLKGSIPKLHWYMHTPSAHRSTWGRPPSLQPLRAQPWGAKQEQIVLDGTRVSEDLGFRVFATLGI